MVQESEDQYGSCDGPNPQYTKLISMEGEEFIIKREYALLSGTIKAMLSGPFLPGETGANEVRLNSISSNLLRKICMYLAYLHHSSKSSTPAEEFPIEPEMAVELLMASNFLDC